MTPSFYDCLRETKEENNSQRTVAPTKRQNPARTKFTLIDLCAESIAEKISFWAQGLDGVNVNNYRYLITGFDGIPDHLTGKIIDCLYSKNKLTPTYLALLLSSDTRSLSLSLGNSKASNQMVKQIAMRAKNIEELEIPSCKRLNSSSVFALSSCRNISSLDLSNCSKVNECAVVDLINNCSRLKKLKLKNLPITNTTLLAISDKIGDNLLQLNVNGCGDITNRGLKTVLDKCCNLEHLHLSACWKINDSSFVDPSNTTFNYNHNENGYTENNDKNKDDNRDNDDDCKQNTKCVDRRDTNVITQTNLTPILTQTLTPTNTTTNTTNNHKKQHKLSKLKILDLSATGIGIDTLIFLQHNCPLITELSLANCVNISVGHPDTATTNVTSDYSNEPIVGTAGNSRKQRRRRNRKNSNGLQGTETPSGASIVVPHVSIFGPEKVYGYQSSHFGAKITKLDLSDCSFDCDDCISHFISLCPNLREIKLPPKILDKTIQTMSTQLKNLEVLILQNCVFLTDEAFENFAQKEFQMRSLKVLNCRGCNLGDKGLEFIAESGAKLEEINVSGCKKITDEGVLWLLDGFHETLRTIKALSCKQLTLSANDFKTSLEQMPNLELLDVRNCGNVGFGDVAELRHSSSADIRRK
eukprot:CAMPEP_0174255900 /NCGR_PEP_ID=MMETSP0439-20130205/5184_1 /TAXON_ID=0 /ORGANISM="Stereomyxa ramosa, Strain Chinc5" /LENGTH=640 /DNA_ID=CAMNT_0015338277 /DNA_START=56 /DNA_END=1978 /DNA_ORIENTATION=+